MINKTLATFSAVLMTLAVFTGTVSVMNYAVIDGIPQENLA